MVEAEQQGPVLVGTFFKGSMDVTSLWTTANMYNSKQQWSSMFGC